MNNPAIHNSAVILPAKSSLAKKCLKLALPHLRPPGERVAIPYEGTTLYGNLRRPAGVECPPVVIMAIWT